MRFSIYSLLLSACIATTAFANESPPPATTTTPPATNDAPVASSTTSPAAPTTTSSTPAAADTKPPFKVPPEYKRKIVNGKVSYCTKTTTVGSRFPKTICVDEEGLRALVELRNSNQDDLRRAQSACTSTASCGGG